MSFGIKWINWVQWIRNEANTMLIRRGMWTGITLMLKPMGHAHLGQLR